MAKLILLLTILLIVTVSKQELQLGGSKFSNLIQFSLSFEPYLQSVNSVLKPSTDEYGGYSYVSPAITNVERCQVSGCDEPVDPRAPISATPTPPLPLLEPPTDPQTSELRKDRTYSSKPQITATQQNVWLLTSENTKSVTT